MIHRLLSSVVFQDRSRPCTEFTDAAFFAGVEVKLVTLQTDKRLVLLQQVVGHCSVGIVADAAIFHYRCVFEHERTLVLGVASEAEIINALLCLQGPDSGAVHIVTIAAVHSLSSGSLVFPDGMVRREHGLHADILVALVTQLRLPLDQEVVF
jgi:hypothetical protein